MQKNLSRINWDFLSRRYMKEINRHPLLVSLREEQAAGRFSGARITMLHYMDVMKFLSSEKVNSKFAPPVRILDVGSYLNLFADFINNYDPVVSDRFSATGIENSPRMCEISDNLFSPNKLLMGDVRDIRALTLEIFDAVVLNNFLHLAMPFPETFIRELFVAIDTVLEPGGMIFYKYDSRRIHNPRNMIIVSSEGKRLEGRNFLPPGYLFSNDPYREHWYTIRKPLVVSTPEGEAV